MAAGRPGDRRSVDFKTAAASEVLAPCDLDSPLHDSRLRLRNLVDIVLPIDRVSMIRQHRPLVLQLTGKQAESRGMRFKIVPEKCPVELFPTYDIPELPNQLIVSRTHVRCGELL